MARGEACGRGEAMRLPPISEAPTATQIRDRVLAQLNGQARISEADEQRRTPCARGA